MALVLAFKTNRRPAQPRKRDLQRWLSAFEALSPTNQKRLLAFAIATAKNDKQAREEQAELTMKGGA